MAHTHEAEGSNPSPATNMMKGTILMDDETVYGNERRYGVCSCCREKKLLSSVIGSCRGRIWTGWLCEACLAAFRGDNDMPVTMEIEWKDKQCD